MAFEQPAERKPSLIAVVLVSGLLAALATAFVIFPAFQADLAWNMGDEVSYYEPTYHVIADHRYCCPYVGEHVPFTERSCFLVPPIWSLFLIPFASLTSGAPYFAVRIAQATLLFAWAGFVAFTWINRFRIFRRGFAAWAEVAVLAGLFVMFASPFYNGRMDLLAGILLMLVAYVAITRPDAVLLIGALIGLDLATHPFSGLIALGGTILSIAVDSRLGGIRRIVGIGVVAGLVFLFIWGPFVVWQGVDDFVRQFGGNVAMANFRGTPLDKLRAIVASPVLVLALLVIVTFVGVGWAYSSVERRLTFVGTCAVYIAVAVVLFVVVMQPTYHYFYQLHPLALMMMLAALEQSARPRFTRRVVAAGVCMGVIFLALSAPELSSLLTRPIEAASNGYNTLVVGAPEFARVGPEDRVLTDSRFYYILRPQTQQLFDVEYFSYHHDVGSDFGRFDKIFLRETAGRSRWFFIQNDDVERYLAENFRAEYFVRSAKRFRWRTLSFRVEDETMIVYTRVRPTTVESSSTGAASP